MISKPTSMWLNHCWTGTPTKFAVSKRATPNSVTWFDVKWNSVSIAIIKPSAKYWLVITCLHYLHALLT